MTDYNEEDYDELYKESKDEGDVQEFKQIGPFNNPVCQTHKFSKSNYDLFYNVVNPCNKSKKPLCNKVKIVEQVILRDK